MHVPFRIHYRNNLIEKKDSCPIPRPPSWDDRNCSYGHQLYPSEQCWRDIKILLFMEDYFREYIASDEPINTKKKNYSRVARSYCYMEIRKY